ncbi:MAG: phosphoglycerate kinase [Holosporales bacterium]|jgi:phosphoglycerate kinase|nr:phosphoglycerate kinase [Holosporales bacterium]
MKTLKEADELGLKNKKALLRVDFNVPIKNGEILDDTKIKDSIPTISWLRDKNAKVILCSHIASSDKSKILSLNPVVDRLSQLIGTQVKFSSACIGKEAEKNILSMQSRDILLLENLRSDPYEEKNSDFFAKKMASMADIYINDAFSVSHRKHASVVGIPKYLPSYAGLSLQETLQEFNRNIKNPARPVMAIVGGKKVSTKLGLLQSLVKKVNTLYVGGAMANTFLLSNGISIGLSVYEPNLLDAARKITKTAHQNNCKLVFPHDVVLDNGQQVSVFNIEANNTIMDVGKGSVEEILNHARQSKTVWWNGPLGKFEVLPFDVGTKSLAKGLADIGKSSSITTIIGGGDTVYALKKSDADFKDYTYISTAGGAFLEFIENLTLPGIEALESDLQFASTVPAWI